MVGIGLGFEAWPSCLGAYKARASNGENKQVMVKQEAAPGPSLAQSRQWDMGQLGNWDQVTLHLLFMALPSPTMHSDQVNSNSLALPMSSASSVTQPAGQGPSSCAEASPGMCPLV